jgi:hypothetical protein
LPADGPACFVEGAYSIRDVTIQKKRERPPQIGEYRITELRKDMVLRLETGHSSLDFY